MDWISIVQNSINEIEDNIYEKLDADMLAQEQTVSSYYFQKMFSTLCGCTVGEYIRNRRLTLAGYEVIEKDISILDIAIKYGYDSAEGFSKAFTRFHGCTPSMFRKEQLQLCIFDRISLINQLTGGKVMMGDLGKRGYVVKETGAVYYTENMERTKEWFTNVLGWYGQIEARDDDGNGTYGCVNNIPIEIESLHIAPFTGIHMFKGKPEKRIVGFMLVEGIEQLHSYVKSKGWNQITDIKVESWGSKTLSITTIDGCILTFFE